VNKTAAFALTAPLFLLASLYPFATNSPEQIGYVGTGLCSLAAFTITMSVLYYALFIKKKK
jgi:hypothetical protein